MIVGKYGKMVGGGAPRLVERLTIPASENMEVEREFRAG